MMITFKHNASLNSPHYRFTWPWHAAALTFITSDTWVIFLMSHYQIWNHRREKDFTITLRWSRTGSVEGCPRTSPQNRVTAEHKAYSINTALKYRKNMLDWAISDNAEGELEYTIHWAFIWSPNKTHLITSFCGNKTTVTCAGNQRLPFFLSTSGLQRNH